MLLFFTQTQILLMIPLAGIKFILDGDCRTKVSRPKPFHLIVRTQLTLDSKTELHSGI